MAQADPTPTRSHLRSPAVAAVLLALLIAAVVVGAYLDWRWWHPTSGIVVTMVAGLLLVLGAIGAATRWRRLLPAAAAAVVAGAGLLLGQAVGPEREAVITAGGTITIDLDRPEGAAEITGPTDCFHTPSGSNYLVSSDPNLRLEIGDQPDEERDTFSVSISQGDMWEVGAEAREDEIGLFVLIGDAGPFTDDASPTEVAMTSTGSSTLELDGAQGAGTLTFSGLAVDPERVGGRQEPIDLAGSIAWECEPIDLPELP